MKRSAVISKDGRYRYVLRRVWDPARPTVLFIGLNPSTADHRADDPTIRRCVRFARDWGFGQLAVGNLFAFRTPRPRDLWTARDPVGSRNDTWLRRLVAEADTTVAAWGAHGARFGRDQIVLEWLGRPMCLAITNDGHPRHPLYIPATARLRDLADQRTPQLRRAY